MPELLEYDVTVVKMGRFTIMAYDLSEAHDKVAAIEENGDLEKYVTQWDETEVDEVY